LADNNQIQQVTEVSLPEAGVVSEYHLSADVPVKLDFYVSEVVFSSSGSDLVLTSEHGGTIVFKDYLVMAQTDTLPVFELHGGEEVPGNVYMFAFNEAASQFETAAGPTSTVMHEESTTMVLSHGHVPVSPFDEGAEKIAYQDATSLFQHGEGHTLTCASIFSDVSHGLLGDVGSGADCPCESSHAYFPDTSVCSLTDASNSVDELVQMLLDTHHHM